MRRLSWLFFVYASLKANCATLITRHLVPEKQLPSRRSSPFSSHSPQTMRLYGQEQFLDQVSLPLTAALWSGADREGSPCAVSVTLGLSASRLAVTSVAGRDSSPTAATYSNSTSCGTWPLWEQFSAVCVEGSAEPVGAGRSTKGRSTGGHCSAPPFHSRSVREADDARHKGAGIGSLAKSEISMRSSRASRSESVVGSLDSADVTARHMTALGVGVVGDIVE